MQCLACHNEQGNRTFKAREMMRGTKIWFDYLECAACGSLQILQVPADLAFFYSGSYYSFRAQPQSGLRKFLKRQRARHALGSSSLTGAAVCKFWGPPEYAEWLLTLGAQLDDAVLDVGCGSGILLKELCNAGFRNLTGIDPFMEKETEASESGFRLLKRDLSAMDGVFDIIMSHHSFEHMPNPRAALADVRRLLKPGGKALIRCPVAACRAWKEYGPDWVQLDAPRHLFIPSIDGFSKLAEATGLDVWKVTCDSYEFQFWGSELYRRDISLEEGRRQSYFSRQAMREFENRAHALNQTMEGDSACFYIRKAERQSAAPSKDSSATKLEAELK